MAVMIVCVKVLRLGPRILYSARKKTTVTASYQMLFCKQVFFAAAESILRRFLIEMMRRDLQSDRNVKDL